MTAPRARLAGGDKMGGGGVHAGLAIKFFDAGVTVCMQGQHTAVYDFQRCIALEKLSVC